MYLATVTASATGRAAYLLHGFQAPRFVPYPDYTDLVTGEDDRLAGSNACGTLMISASHSLAWRISRILGRGQQVSFTTAPARRHPVTAASSREHDEDRLQRLGNAEYESGANGGTVELEVFGFDRFVDHVRGQSQDCQARKRDEAEDDSRRQVDGWFSGYEELKRGKQDLLPGSC